MGTRLPFRPVLSSFRGVVEGSPREAYGAPLRQISWEVWTQSSITLSVAPPALACHISAIRQQHAPDDPDRHPVHRRALMSSSREESENQDRRGDWNLPQHIPPSEPLLHNRRGCDSLTDVRLGYLSNTNDACHTEDSVGAA